MDIETILLVVAQCLFMLLPITGLYTMRAGKPAKLAGTWHQWLLRTTAWQL